MPIAGRRGSLDVNDPLRCPGEESLTVSAASYSQRPSVGTNVARLGSSRHGSSVRHDYRRRIRAVLYVFRLHHLHVQYLLRQGLSVFTPVYVGLFVR